VSFVSFVVISSRAFKRHAPEPVAASSERNEWMLRHHPVFQQYHFLQHPSADRHAREDFRSSPHFDYTARYCELYDQNSFDPDFSSLPLAHFEPIVEAFFSRFDGIDSLRLPA